MPNRKKDGLPKSGKSWSAEATAVNSRGVISNSQTDLKRILGAKRVWFLTTNTWSAYKFYQRVLPLLGDVETLLGEPRRGLFLLKPNQAAPALDCSRFEAKEGK